MFWEPFGSIGYALTLCFFMCQLQGDLLFLKEDIETVQRQCQDLSKAKEKYLLENRMPMDKISSDWDPSVFAGVDSSHNSRAVYRPGSGQGGVSHYPGGGNSEGLSLSINPTKKEICSIAGSLDNCLSVAQRLPDGLTVAKKRRVLAQVPVTLSYIQTICICFALSNLLTARSTWDQYVCSWSPPYMLMLEVTEHVCDCHCS